MKKLVLLRHGESQWNRENRFTGWKDVDLTDKGIEEARASGKLLRAQGFDFDFTFTSVLKRAIRTLNFALEEMDRLWLPVEKDWRLNERHYGALQGLDKSATREKYGDEKFMEWRRSYDVPPPPIEAGSSYDNASEERYAGLASELVPATECLADVVVRMLPYWYDAIVPDLRAGETVLVTAHGNSLRALVKHLDGLTEDEVVGLNIPTGQPLVYTLDGALQPTARGGAYLDPVAAAAAAEAVAKQGH